jgi:hypothetical protein
VGPHVEELISELGELRLIKDKVDHPSKGYKDLSDATCGAIFNAIAHTPRPASEPVEVKTYADIAREAAAEASRQRELEMEKNPTKFGGVIRPPESMPKELLDWLNAQIL